MRESGGRVSGGDRLHARGKARDLPRGGVAVQHAAGHSALDFRLRVLQRFARAVGVTGGDCQFDLLTKVRIRLMRAPLMAARRAFLRIRFLAEI